MEGAHGGGLMEGGLMEGAHGGGLMEGGGVVSWSHI